MLGLKRKPTYNIDDYVEKATALQRRVQDLVRASLPPQHFFNLVDPQPRKYKEYLSNYTGWVYTCASRNASAVASVPLRLYVASKNGVRKGVESRKITRKQHAYLNTKSHLGPLMSGVEVEEIIQHPWLELIRKVNQFNNGFEMIELMVINLELTGNAYWYLQRDGLGVPYEIWPLESHLVSLKKNIRFGIEKYLYGQNNIDLEQLDTEEVVHFKYPNPLDPFYGMGPLEASILPVTLNNRFDAYENSVLENGAVIPFFLTTDQNFNEQNMSRFREQFGKIHRGYKKAGIWAMLTGGFKPTTVGNRPKDVNYKDGHFLTKEKIAAAFGVPLSLLTTDNVNKANADAGLEQYMKFTIVPKLKRIEQVLNQDVMPIYDDRLFVAFDNPVPEDKDYQLKASDANLKNWSITINEARRARNEEDVEWGDEPLVQGDVKKLSQSLENADKPDPIMPEIPDLPEEEEIEARHTHFQTKTISPHASDSLKRHMAQWINTMAIITAHNVASITIQSPNDVDVFLPWHEFKEQGEDLLRDDLTATLHGGAQEGSMRLSKVGISSSWSVSNPVAIQWAKEQVGKRITLINDQTREAIRSVVSESLREGRTMVEIRNDIRKHIGLNRPQSKALENYRIKLQAQGQPDYVVNAATSEYRQKLVKQRAEMIARTETSSAWAEGNIASYREAGVESKEFSSANDACPICAPLDGKTYPIGSDEVVIPLHPQCRCSWLPYIEV